MSANGENSPIMMHSPPHVEIIGSSVGNDQDFLALLFT